MNIFILSNETDPEIHFREQAAYHNNKHVVKMINEGVQMLVTAAEKMVPQFTQRAGNSFPCMPLTGGHAAHPCMLWVQCDMRNFAYLARLTHALVNEHQYRYPLSVRHQYWHWIHALYDHINAIGYAMPTKFAVVVKPEPEVTIQPLTDACNQYRNYYVRHKSHIAVWKRRCKPCWFLLREDFIESTKP